MELIAAYRSASDGFGDLVARVRPDQWARPTPCEAWTVRELVNHVVYEDRWAVPLLNGDSLSSVGSRFDGDLLGDDPVRATRDALAGATAAVSAPGALDRSVELSFGMTAADEYVRQLLAEHLVHGWDLAVAIDADRDLDGALVDEVAVWFPANEEAFRAGGAIAAAVAVPATAGPQDRLIAAFGRDPRWTGQA